MNEFIERNRVLLKLYCIVARIIGWLLIAGGFFWFLATISSIDTSTEVRPEGLLYVISSMLFDFMLPGLVALMVMQFIDYLFEDRAKPGWLLGMADWLLYAYAVFVAVRAFLRYMWYSDWYAQEISLEVSRLLFVQPFLLPTVAKILILVGLAQIIRRLIPAIEESKTLV